MISTGRSNTPTELGDRLSLRSASSTAVALTALWCSPVRRFFFVDEAARFLAGYLSFDEGVSSSSKPESLLRFFVGDEVEGASLARDCK